jgi:hypothetical protein
LGLNKIKALEPCAPVRRYQREGPGEMVHLDIKKLGRIDHIGHRITGERKGQSTLRTQGKGPGWAFVPVAIEDALRIGFAKVMNSERRRSAYSFLKAALAYHESLGIKVERVMTDNGRWKIGHRGPERSAISRDHHRPVHAWHGRFGNDESHSQA